MNVYKAYQKGAKLFSLHLPLHLWLLHTFLFDTIAPVSSGRDVCRSKPGPHEACKSSSEFDSLFLSDSYFHSVIMIYTDS